MNLGELIAKRDAHIEQAEVLIGKSSRYGQGEVVAHAVLGLVYQMRAEASLTDKRLELSRRPTQPAFDAPSEDDRPWIK